MTRLRRLGHSTLATLLGMTTFALAPFSWAATVWESDAARSRLEFTSAYDKDEVKGTFRTWNATIAFDANDLGSSQILVNVDTGSVQTGVDEQDGALLSGEWFDVKRHPQARFVTRQIRRGSSDNQYDASGELTLRGVTRPVSITFTASESASELTLKGSATLDRTQFDVGMGSWKSASPVPFQVGIQFDVVARRTDAVSGPIAPPAPSAASAAQPSTQPAARAQPAATDWRSVPVADYQPTPAFPNQTRAPAPSVASAYKTEVLTTGLVQPWSLAFLPDGRMLVTERPGRMRIIAPDGKKSAPIDGLPIFKTIAAEGLHDVVLDPDFARNRTLYFSYYAPLPNDEPPTLQGWIDWLKLPAGEHEKQPYGFERVASARLSKDERRLENVKVILEGGNRRIAFAPDGSMFVAASPPAGGGIPVDEEPQRLENTYGKVLRILRNGKIPRDNPFVRRSGVRPEIYAYGLRDIEGAAIHPRTGELWTVEHGPRGGDELNIVRAGRNYGFPIISYGREYSGELINGGKTQQEGLEQPVYFWTPSIAPSGLLFYTGDLFPQWKNSVFVGAMAGKRLIRLELDGERVVAEEALLVERGKRIRDVRQGPDGALYVLTAEAEGELLRLTPR